MNNFLSYYGLVDARVGASEKDLPVIQTRLIEELDYLNCSENL